MAENRFLWADYVVAVAMLLVSLGIGFFFALFKGGQKTKVEYLLGNREMNVGPVCLSMFVTFMSAISLIGTPSDTYNTGPMIMYTFFGISLAYFLGIFTVVPLMYPLHLTSVYTYLEMRFQSNAVRLLAAAFGMFQTILYMGVALFSPALALQSAAGIPLWVSIAIVGGIGTVYTSVGGIKSVVWTDAFQTVVLFVGIAAVLIKGVSSVGSFSSVIDIAYDGGRMQFADLDPDPRSRHGMWACLVGGCFMWLVNLFNQSAIQRIGSLKTISSAKWVYVFNVPLNMAFGSILTVTGLLLYAYVVTIGCDPLEAGYIANTNQMMPYFVLHVLNDLPGMAGLYMSTLFSGALSTVSSGINALAANTVEDLLARPLRRLSDGTVTVIAKILVVFFGFVTVGLAYLMKSMSGPVTQLATSAFGACGGPVVGIFFLGAAFPRGNKYGALAGGVLGLAVNLWIAIGTRLYGAPMATLPPGPIDNCTSGNLSTLLATSASYNDVTTPNITNLASSVNYHGISGHDDVMSAIIVSTGSGSLDRTQSSVSERPFSIYDISYLWFGLIGLLVSFLSGVVVSLLSGGQDPKSVDSRLIFPFCRKLYGLPEPEHYPADSSNVIAMQNYRKAQDAWDEFKRTSVDLDVTDTDGKAAFKNGPEAEAFVHHDKEKI